jgi:hypothetical protein
MATRDAQKVSRWAGEAERRFAATLRVTLRATAAAAPPELRPVKLEPADASARGGWAPRTEPGAQDNPESTMAPRHPDGAGGTVREAVLGSTSRGRGKIRDAKDVALEGHEEEVAAGGGGGQAAARVRHAGPAVETATSLASAEKRSREVSGASTRGGDTERHRDRDRSRSHSRETSRSRSGDWSRSRDTSGECSRDWSRSSSRQPAEVVPPDRAPAAVLLPPLPPAPRSFSSLQDMGTPEVVAWLASIFKRDAELAGYVRFVEENEIDGYVLLDLIEQGQISELGITKPLHQSKLRANAKKLQLAADSAPPGNVALQSEITPDMSRSVQLAASTEAPAHGRQHTGKQRPELVQTTTRPPMEPARSPPSSYSAPSVPCVRKAMAPVPDTVPKWPAAPAAERVEPPLRYGVVAKALLRRSADATSEQIGSLAIGEVIAVSQRRRTGDGRVRTSVVAGDGTTLLEPLVPDPPLKTEEICGATATVAAATATGRPLVQRLQSAARETVAHGAVSLEPTWEAEAPLELDQGKLFGQSGAGTNGGRQAGWDTQRRQPGSASDGGAAVTNRVSGRNDAMLDGWFDREPDLHRADLQTGWCNPTCGNAHKTLLDALWSMDPDRLAEAIDCFAGIKWRDVRNKPAYVASTLDKNFGADWNSAGAPHQPMPQRAHKRPMDGRSDGRSLSSDRFAKRHKDAGDAPRGGNAVAHIAMQASHAIVTFYDSAFPARFLGDRREVKVDDTPIDGLKIRRDRGCADAGALFCGWKPGTTATADALQAVFEAPRRSKLEQWFESTGGGLRRCDLEGGERLRNGDSSRGRVCHLVLIFI